MFENNYTNIIEPIYGNKRDNTYDIQLTQNINEDHQFKIKERFDFTNIDVYSIDPEGCLDADDAFSIYETDNKLYLAIHIADPTDFIDINSKLWEDINNRTTTKYLSNRKPIHMMPDEVLELSSLMENTKGNIKSAITILTEIDKTNYNPINNIKILFTKIKVHHNNAFTYNYASRLDIPAIKIGLLIANALEQLRSKKTKGVKLNDLSMAYPVYRDNDIYLYVDTQQEKNIKQMKQLKAYSGAPIPEPLQHVSASVWSDEEHVVKNRKIYEKKYKIADQIFGDFDGYFSPEAGFFLWMNVGDGEKVALELWQNCGVRVLPGRYLAKDFNGQSPGDQFIRVAMVSELEETKRGLSKIREFLREKQV